MNDGIVTIRPSTTDDAPVLILGRDEEFKRFMGEGSPEPRPAACIVVGDAVVGWVDYDHDREWLAPDEVNLGYNVFGPYRGRGYATRAVRLLLRHLALDTEWRVATLLIHPDNARSLRLARSAGFEPFGDLDGNPYWKQPVAAALDSQRQRTADRGSGQGADEAC
jgi:RimJ/RimL family protein N-acetyltransferase